MGLSASVTFAVAIWRGTGMTDTLRPACLTGLQTGALSWVTGVCAAQLGRICVEQEMCGTTDSAV